MPNETTKSETAITESGHWTAGRWVEDGRIFVQSDDFTHDALLYVDGDFASDFQRWEYACEIAKRLNAWDAQRVAVKGITP